MPDALEPYRHHIARLQSENQELREILRQQKAVSAEKYRVLRAQIEEGLTPKVSALQARNRRLRQDNDRLRRSLSEDQRVPWKKSVTINPSVRQMGSRTHDVLQQFGPDSATAHAFRKVKQKLRGVSVVIEQTRELLTVLRDSSEDFSPEVYAELAELVELRREELLELEQMMRSAPASASHRGVKSYRPIPSNRGTI